MLVGGALLGRSGIILCLLLLAFAPTSAADFTRVDRPPTVVKSQPKKVSKDIAAHQYKGYLRLFVAEPISRYVNGDPHLHGVLGIPLDIELTLNYPDTLKGDLVYNDVNIDSKNIEVIGAVYEYTGHPAFSDSDPPGNPFTAHFAEAATAATPGHPGMDEATPPYTHTVFVEYVTRYS
jgi:hypothetical protein